MSRESERSSKAQGLFRAANAADVRAKGCLVVHVEGNTIALFCHEDKIYAIDNRCPHMGFPLERGTVKDGVLTCHWHHARFDLASGGTFDQFAGDVRAFPVEMRDGEVWVDVAGLADRRAGECERLQIGLERNIPLVLGKAVLELSADPVGPFRIGLKFGARYRQAGWRQGLTIHTCMVNLLPHLDPEARPRALYHGLSAVAQECSGEPARFPIRPLPDTAVDVSTLKRWFRQFVEVRDAEGAERCIVSAVRAGANHEQMADLLFAAVTDHRYIETGHVADFTNKAFEALDVAGWEHADLILSSLAGGYAHAERMEESNAWRHPVDLVAILEHAFTGLPAMMESGRSRRGRWSGREAIVPVLLADDPQAIADGLLAALREGATEDELAQTVTYAAALRIAQFHTSNEFRDWDTALHTFTFANAIHQGLRRAPSCELLRGVFDAGMSIYLDRFLNVPVARLPEPAAPPIDPSALLETLPALLDQQQQVNQTGQLIADYLHGGGKPDRLLAALGSALLREDRDFHTIQVVEAAFRQYTLLAGNPQAEHVLVAAGRYLAAHAPTARAQGQTYQIAYRLRSGDRLFEGSQ